MMHWRRQPASIWKDPGPCIICGAPHQTCTGTTGTVIVVPTLGAARALTREPVVETPPAAVTFTTVTYPAQVKRKRATVRGR